MALYAITQPFSQQIFSWLKGHLLPCPFKFITHIDCPGCGFQRSLIALFQGNIQQSFNLYPPTIPLLIAFLYFAISGKFKLDNNTGKGKKIIFIIAATIVTVSYIIKLWHLHRGYTASV